MICEEGGDIRLDPKRMNVIGFGKPRIEFGRQRADLQNFQFCHVSSRLGGTAMSVRHLAISVVASLDARARRCASSTGVRSVTRRMSPTMTR